MNSRRGQPRVGACVETPIGVGHPQGDVGARCAVRLRALHEQLLPHLDAVHRQRVGDARRQDLGDGVAGGEDEAQAREGARHGIAVAESAS